MGYVQFVPLLYWSFLELSVRCSSRFSVSPPGKIHPTAWTGSARRRGGPAGITDETNRSFVEVLRDQELDPDGDLTVFIGALLDPSVEVVLVHSRAR